MLQTRSFRTSVVEASLFAAAVVAIALAFSGIEQLYWTYDDAFLLRVAEIGTPVAYATSRAFWDSMPARMFVPGVLIWYEIGSRLASAAQFYILSVALLVAALTAAYAALRQWLDSLPALTTISIIGFAPATISVVLQLMAGHYMMALLFAALSTLLWTRALRRRSFASSLASAIFYLFAMLSKEIAIPLPALLLLLPERRLTDRVRLAVPHIVSVAVYMLWRRLMIGTFFGGYGWAVTKDNIDELLQLLPTALATAALPPDPRLAAIFALLLAIPVAMWMRTPARATAFLIAIVVSILPIVPVAREMQPRYVFVLSATTAVFVGIGLAHLPARARVSLAVAIAIAATAGHIAEWRRSFPTSSRMSEESRFVVAAPPDATLRSPAVPPAAMGELQWIRARSGAAPGFSWFYDDLYLCMGRLEGRRFYEYDPVQRAVVERTSQMPGLARRHCGAIRPNAPLAADFESRDGTLAWKFGPYEQGRWRVVFANGLQAFAVPREDVFILGEIPSISLRVRYDHPAGWTTYSPEITIPLVGNANTSWRR